MSTVNVDKETFNFEDRTIILPMAEQQRFLSVIKEKGGPGFTASFLTADGEKLMGHIGFIGNFVINKYDKDSCDIDKI